MINLLVAILGPILKVAPAPPPVPEGATGVRVFRASDRYLSYRYALTTLATLPVLLPALIIAVAVPIASKYEGKIPLWLAIVLPGLYLSVVLFFVALAFVATRLDYEFHCYVTTDRSMRIRQGIMEQVEATLTYANVQNVRVEQGPLERFFGIASVIVDTAGGASKAGDQQRARGVVRGIEDAASLRDQIMEKMRASKSSGLGDPDDHHDHEPSGDHLDLSLLREVRDEARALAKALSAKRSSSHGEYWSTTR